MPYVLQILQGEDVKDVEEEKPLESTKESQTTPPCSKKKI